MRLAACFSTKSHTRNSVISRQRAHQTTRVASGKHPRLLARTLRRRSPRPTDVQPSPLGLMIRDFADHLPCRLVQPHALIRGVADATTSRPAYKPDLNHKLGSHPANATANDLPSHQN